jgi:hypothetical protein
MLRLCTECGKNFETLRGLKKHRLLHHGMDAGGACASSSLIAQAKKAGRKRPREERTSRRSATEESGKRRRAGRGRSNLFLPSAAAGSAADLPSAPTTRDFDPMLGAAVSASRLTAPTEKVVSPDTLEKMVALNDELPSDLEMVDDLFDALPSRFVNLTALSPSRDPPTPTFDELVVASTANRGLPAATSPVPILSWPAGGPPRITTTLGGHAALGRIPSFYINLTHEPAPSDQAAIDLSSAHGLAALDPIVDRSRHDPSSSLGSAARDPAVDHSKLDQSSAHGLAARDPTVVHSRRDRSTVRDLAARNPNVDSSRPDTSSTRGMASRSLAIALSSTSVVRAVTSKDRAPADQTSTITACTTASSVSVTRPVGETLNPVVHTSLREGGFREWGSAQPVPFQTILAALHDMPTATPQQVMEALRARYAFSSSLRKRVQDQIAGIIFGMQYVLSAVATRLPDSTAGPEVHRRTNLELRRLLQTFTARPPFRPGEI